MVKTRQYDGRMMIVRFGISFSPSYSRDFSMVLWYCCVFTIEVSCFRVTTIALSYYHHRNIVVSPSYYRGFIIALSRIFHHTIVFSPLYYRRFTIVVSWFLLSPYHHRTIAFSSSHYRVFIIVLPRYHHRTIALSLWHYCVFIKALSPSGAHTYTHLTHDSFHDILNIDRYIII